MKKFMYIAILIAVILLLSGCKEPPALSITFGKDSNDNNMEWVPIDFIEADNVIELVAKRPIMEGGEYVLIEYDNSENLTNDWSISTIRKYLTDDPHVSFNDYENSAIKILDRSDISYTNNPVQDKVFLPSYWELLEFGLNGGAPLLSDNFWAKNEAGVRDGVPYVYTFTDRCPVNEKNYVCPAIYLDFDKIMLYTGAALGTDIPDSNGIMKSNNIPFQSAKLTVLDSNMPIFSCSEEVFYRDLNYNLVLTDVDMPSPGCFIRCVLTGLANDNIEHTKNIIAQGVMEYDVENRTAEINFSNAWSNNSQLTEIGNPELKIWYENNLGNNNNTNICGQMFSIPILELSDSKLLMADTTDNNVGNDLEIRFKADEDYENAISDISFNGTALTEETDYVVGSGIVTLKPSGENSVFQSPVTGDVEIVAVGYCNSTVSQIILPIEYTIDYDLDGGENDEANPLTYNILDETIILNYPTKPDYTFDGWYSDSSCTNEVLSIPAGSSGNLILYSKWSPTEYTIDYDLDGGENDAANPLMYNFFDDTIILNYPTKPGFNFYGWYDSPDFSTANHIQEITTGSTGNIDLYALWAMIIEDDEIIPPPTPTLVPVEPVVVIINGKEENAASVTKTEENGITTVIVSVNSDVIEESIKNQENTINNNIVIPVADTTSDIVRVSLEGDIVKQLEDDDYTMNIIRNGVQYNIPAKEINIEAIAQQLNVSQSTLNEIEIEVQMSKVSEEALQMYEAMTAKNNNELIVSPVEFNIVAKIKKADGTEFSVEINRFSSYVERVMIIPEVVDPSKITTGIVFNSDGTYSHVPTVVFVENGIWYARLKSLTNSVYAVIWNSATVPPVENHWSKPSVNDMASRLIIGNPESFTPEGYITRGEFAEYITKALGLYRNGAAKPGIFSDVSVNDPLGDAITIASEYDIINGYPDGTFKSESTITRQEAMAMYTNAMVILKLGMKDENRINNYSDRDQVSEWAYESVKTVLASGVFNGTSETTISPLSTFKYGEAATAIRNLLTEAGLINK